MSGHTVQLFDPFNLQHGSNRDHHIKTQEVIYYAESRFRQALASISRADINMQSWMQKCLHQEVVSVC